MAVEVLVLVADVEVGEGTLRVEVLDVEEGVLGVEGDVGVEEGVLGVEGDVGVVGGVLGVEGDVGVAGGVLEGVVSVVGQERSEMATLF